MKSGSAFISHGRFQFALDKTYGNKIIDKKSK
jgi:hypothetical protein